MHTEYSFFSNEQMQQLSTFFYTYFSCFLNKNWLINWLISGESQETRWNCSFSEINKFKGKKQQLRFYSQFFVKLIPEAVIY